MSTTYIQKRIIGLLVTDLLAAGFLIDVNDNDADRETHLHESRDHAAIMAAIFNPEIDSADYCLDCFKADRQDHHSTGFVRLIDGNGTTVISDYSTCLEPYLVNANALADLIDLNETAWMAAELSGRAELLAALIEAERILLAQGNTPARIASISAAIAKAKGAT